MGGRGTFAIGNQVPYSYITVDFIEGVKVLKGLNGKHNLPEESHSSNSYIRLTPDGVFHEMRLYNNKHYLTFELAYHPEPKIDPSHKPVLHYHIYDKSFKRSEAIKAPQTLINRFAKYLKGISL